MGMSCRICNAPMRLEIDRALVSGQSKASISREYGVSENSLLNHAREHLSRQLTQAYQQKELAESMDLLTRIEDLLDKARKIFNRNFKKATSTGDQIALKALSEQRSTIELLAKIAAFLHESRAMELQAQDEDYEHRKEAEAKEFVERALDRLNDREADLWEKLLLKIHGETDEDILPYEPPVWPPDRPTKRTTKLHRRSPTEPKAEETDPLSDEPDDKQTQEHTPAIGPPPSKVILNSSEDPGRLPRRLRSLRRRMINAKMMEPDPDLDN